MRGQKQFGIFWGPNAFFFVESHNHKVDKCEVMPFDTTLDKNGEKEAASLPDGLRYTALIQKAINEQGISSKKVRLSLPAKDLIFRSFMIPWMEVQEVHNVVEFEAIKYIPIKLQELSYTYHPQAVTENNEKSIRVLFVAIRKDILGKYSGILEHSGLRIEYIEPAPVSMARLMLKGGHMAPHNTTAILEIGKDAGQIIIVEQGVIQFVREINLPVDMSNQGNLVTALSNDIRVSFNFFNRQNTTGKIVKIILTSPLNLEEAAKAFNKEFDIPTVFVSTEKYLPNQKHLHLGLLNALGVTLRDKTFSTKNFDLTDQSADQMRKMRQEIDWKRFKVPAVIASACLLILLSVYLFSSRTLRMYQTQIARIQSQQIAYQSQSATDIDKLANEAYLKLYRYKSVRLKSNVINFLSIIPNLMPDGMWLNSFHISYSDPSLPNPLSENPQNQIPKPEELKPAQVPITLTIDGKAYLPNPNEQFRQPNIFITTLRDNEELDKYFKNFDLLNIRQEQLYKYLVTVFSIKCQ